MSYENAPATILLATHCLWCNRPLVDAVSVEMGIGPVCRGKAGLDAATTAARPEANALVHEAALADTTNDRRVAIADAVRALGFVALADRILERFLGDASTEVRLAHGDAAADVEIWADGRGGRRALVVSFRYDPDLVAAVKTVAGRRYDGGSKTWSVPDTRDGRLALLNALAGHMVDCDGIVGLAIDAPLDAWIENAPPAPPNVTIATEGHGRRARLFVAFDTYRPDAVAAVKGIQGRRWHSDRKAWSVPATDRARARLAEALDGLDLTYDRGTLAPADVAPVASPAAVAAVAVDAAIEKGARAYQAKGVHWLATVGTDAPGVVLADDMGLGKTMQALLALPAVPGGPKARALVVAPKALVGNWAAEVARWRPDLTTAAVTAKTWRLPAPGEVVIVNYAGLPKRLAVKVPGKRWTAADLTDDEVEALSATTLILDEAEAVSNWKAQRTQRIRNLRHGARAAWALTGTPMASRPQQLWGLLATLGASRRAFGSFDNFVEMFGGYRKRWGGYDWRAADVDTPRVVDALSGVMLRRTKAEALPELPSKIRTEVTVPTPRAMRRTLDAALACWPEAERGTLPRDATQYAAVRRQLAESRIPVMLERVNVAECADTPLVVYSAHRAPIEALAAREGWGVVLGGQSSEVTDATVAAFQAGRLKGIGITSAGARGLTLTAASRMLLVDLPWTPAEVDQVEDRICRIGQTAAGLVYERLVSDHPLDLRVLAILDAKRAIGAATVEAATVAPEGPTSHVAAR